MPQPTITNSTLTLSDGSVLGYTLRSSPLPNAPRLVLIHSLALDRSVWDGVVDQLAGEGHMLTYDCRGHGQSERRATAYTAELFAKDLAELLDHVGWTSATVAGCSMGGCVALSFAGLFPHRVTALGLIDTTAWYGADAPEKFRERADAAKAKGMAALFGFQATRWFSDEFRASHPEVLQRTLDVFVASDLDCYAASCDLLGAVDVRAYLPTFRMPVAVVVGEEDYATPVEMARQLHEAVPQSTMTVLARARHLTPIEHPGAIASELRALNTRATERRVSEPASAAALIARLERVPFSRWHLRARVIMGSATFFDAFDALSLAFVLPVLVPLWKISAVEIGWLIAAGYLGQFVGALLFGGLAERYGRVPSAAGATALMSVLSLACALAGNLPTLLVLRLVQGIGVGGEMPVAAVYINELSKAKGRGRFFMLYEMIFPVGLMVTGQVGALVVPTLGWQVMFLIGAAPGLIIAGLLLRLRESPRWLIGRGRLSEAEAIIREIEASAPVDLEPPPPVQEAAPARVENNRTRWPELLSPIYRGRTAIVWTLWASAYFITNGLNNWMPTLYNRVYGLSLEQSLRAGTLTNVAQVVILLGCAFAIDRTGRRRWMMVCFAAGAVLLAALGSFASGSVTAVIVLVTLSYGIVGSVNAVLYLYTPEIYPTRMRAIGTGSATCWLRLASAAGPLLVGYLVAAQGIGAVFLMFAAAGLIGAVAATKVLETRNRRLEDIAP